MSKVHYVKNVNSNAPIQPHDNSAYLFYTIYDEIACVCTVCLSIERTEKSVLYLKSVWKKK